MLEVEDWGVEPGPSSALAEGELEASWLGLAYFMEDGDLSRPVGEFGGAES